MEQPERRWGEIGPLGVRWLEWTMQELRAGARSSFVVVADNVGSAAWYPSGDRGIYAAYHWLDSRGNPIVWGGQFSHLRHPVPPGEQTQIELDVTGPMPPGRYRLAVDLVAEGRCWFAEVGNEPLEFDVEVLHRLRERSLAVAVRPGPEERRAETLAALAGQDEPLGEEGKAEAVAHLAAGCVPAPDWSRRILDAHDEGYAAVGGSVEPDGRRHARRGLRATLAPWAPGRGRNPSFAHPLLCPSIVAGEEPAWLEDVAGLPAASPSPPAIFDGRIRLRYRP